MLRDFDVQICRLALMLPEMECDLLYQHQWVCLISQGGLLAVGLGSPRLFEAIDRTCL